MQSFFFVRVQALPFSSLPKYVVHLSFLASLLNSKELLLHLLEQNHKIDPSFLMYIMPVPAGNSAPQNEHFLGLGTGGSSKHFSLFWIIWLFSWLLFLFL
jgi:hypothetical protein